VYEQIELSKRMP